MELNLLNDQGQAAAKVEAPDTIFGRDFNEPLIHQVVTAYQANARSANRQQKALGRARPRGEPPGPYSLSGRSRRSFRCRR